MGHLILPPWETRDCLQIFSFTEKKATNIQTITVLWVESVRFWCVNMSNMFIFGEVDVVLVSLVIINLKLLLQIWLKKSFSILNFIQEVFKKSSLPVINCLCSTLPTVFFFFFLTSYFVVKELDHPAKRGVLRCLSLWIILPIFLGDTVFCSAQRTMSRSVLLPCSSEERYLCPELGCW